MSSAAERPRRWEWMTFTLFLIALVAFGVLVEFRAAFQETSKTDFGVYARAAWAVRAGEDLYTVIDNNGFHYCYPPAFAILLIPLADPLPWLDRTGYLPFSVSIALWFAFGVACATYATHTLAKAVLPDAIPGSRRWWYARSMPVFVCLTSLGYSLSRGQVNVLVLALVSGLFAAVIAGQRFKSGLWLAGAVTLKIIPAYLVLFPLLRRDGRALAGSVIGGVLLLGVLPAAVWGIQGSMEQHHKLINGVLLPGTTGKGDQTRAEELTNTTSTDSQSFAAVIHALLHPDREMRPRMASRETRLVHWGIGCILTLVTLVVATRMRSFAPARQLIVLGCLCLLMALLTPVSHMHYYAMGFPLVAGLWLKGLTERPHSHMASPATTFILIVWGVLTSIPLLPGEPFERLREGGLGTVASLGLWAFGLWSLRAPNASKPLSPTIVVVTKVFFESRTRFGPTVPIPR